MTIFQQLTFLLLGFTTFSNPSTITLNKYELESGRRCMEKCLAPIESGRVVSSFAVYLPKDSSEYPDFVDWLNLKTQSAKTEWKKVRAENCVGDSDDCFKWCSIDSPAKYNNLPIVIDTSKTDQYKIIKVEHIQYQYQSKIRDRVEVLCEDEVTESFLENLKTKMLKLGFLKRENTDIGKEGVLKALYSYQKYHSIPMGSITLSSIEKLGIMR